MYHINEWIVFLLAALTFSMCVEIGYRFGRRAVHVHGKEASTHISTIEGALLGLLALLLGFAFSMAMSRYDSRRVIVINEANDLQTTFLRSKLLDAPYRTQAGQLLLEYVDSRLEYLNAGTDITGIDSALRRSTDLQTKLWDTALAAARANPEEVTTGYFIESLNGLIDDHTKRLTAMESHVPDIIIVLLLFVGAMTLAMSGYSSGFTGTRLAVPRIIMIVLIAATLLVIIDLDRPRRGLITVSEHAMRDLHTAMHRELNQTITR